MATTEMTTYVLRVRFPKKEERVISDTELVRGLTSLGCQVGYASEFEINNPKPSEHMTVKVPQQMEEGARYYIGRSRHRVWLELKENGQNRLFKDGMLVLPDST